MAEGVASEPVRGLVPYEDGCVTPTQPYSMTQVSTELTVMLTKTTTAPVSETRTLLLKLIGSDTQAPSPQWEVVSGLTPWLTINGFHLDANNSLPLPPSVGKRLDQTTAWIVEVSVTISPVGLAERPVPYTTDLVLGVHSQRSGRVSITAKIGVSATPVASSSAWGRISFTGGAQSRGCADIEAIADVLTLAVGDSEDIPFQSCDVEGLQVQHSVPTQEDPRYFTAALVDATGAAIALDVQYTGAGAYQVRLAARSDSFQLGSYRLELRLDGLIVHKPLLVEVVCRPTTYRDADHTCKLCHEMKIGGPSGEPDLEYAPKCVSKGVTLETLELADRTWRTSNSSMSIFVCKRSKGCRGGIGNLSYDYEDGTREMSSFSSADGYCGYGYTGALCTACQPNFFKNPNKECEECRNTARGIAILFGIILGVLLLGYLLYLNRRRVRACLIVMSVLRRTITMARLKIVLSTFQITASVLWGVPDVQWPEPFSSFASVLEMFNFFIVGTSCISDGYNYYIQIFIVTLTPIFLSAVLVVVGCVRLRCVAAGSAGSVGRGGKAVLALTLSEERAARREAIVEQHWWLFILLTYCVLPSTSVSVIRLFLCHEGFGEAQDEAYLRADYTLQCYTLVDGVPEYTTGYLAMRVYAWLMVFIYPVGINAMYLGLLLRHRATINPREQNLTKALLIRQSNPSVQYFGFIYKYYTPSCFFFEVVDSVRRLLLGGLFVFYSEANDALNCWWSFLIAFLFYVIFRETQPYVDPTNNTLAVVAQLVIMLLFLGGFILSVQPFDYDPAIWGWILFLTGIFVVTLALWFQYRYGSNYLEMQLRLMEHEFRDVELAISMAESRRDVDVLKAKVDALKAAALDAEDAGKVVADDALLPAEQGSYSSQLIEQLQLNMTLSRSGASTAAGAKHRPPRSKKVQLQQAGKKVVKALAPRSLQGYEARYPCYVISLTQLAKLDRLRPHEELLQAGVLEELTRTSYQPAGAFTFFISQNWESA